MRRTTLLGQVVGANLLLILAAVIATALSSEFTFSFHDHRQVSVVLGLALALTLAVNFWLLQRRFAPLERLIEDMERVDLSRPHANIPSSIDGLGETQEVERLELAFLRMLRRLEAERRRSAGIALLAQEQERARIARDLHDEVNQALTGILLHIEAAREAAPPELEPELAETKALANQAMEELVALARQLRPTALDDLGLQAALESLVADFSTRTGIRGSMEYEGDLSQLPDDEQLVIYRVSQEALSNVAQHSGASRVHVRAAIGDDGEVALDVHDDGSGFVFDEADNGLGLAGMRERALLVGGNLAIESRPGRGTAVFLRLPSRIAAGEPSA